MDRFKNALRLVKNKGGQLVAAVTATAAAGTASAGELATAWTSEASGAKAEILLVGVALLTVTGVIYLIRRTNSVAK